MNREHFMQRAIDLAKKGWPMVAPNPMVACVIVHRDQIVAEGYHQQFGQAHAEVNAIKDLPASIRPQDCELYVTLEPCSHQGKTPPCADLIISKGFKKVIIASMDPNPLVSGRGIKKLETAGIKVVSGILEKEARQLNKRFFTFFEKKRPYIFLKWAQTADGFISRLPVPLKREENIISGEVAQKRVHQIRAQVMGIFVGKNTVLNDNPFLTTRLVAGKNPVRIFMDERLEVPRHFNIYNKEAETIVFNAITELEEDNIQFIKIDFNDNLLLTILNKLYEKNIQSILIEGGARLLNGVLAQNLWDEILIFENPDLEFTKGLLAPAVELPSHFETLGGDKMYRLLKSKNPT
jgi:diaminohydroxyphosphoribosylaminopyrimidine deaminase / 5-amino-6-(5-phosphoribosylamino)uracil reductase